MVVKVCDKSGEGWISSFTEEAEQILGCTADELDQLKSEVFNNLPPTESKIDLNTVTDVNSF